MRRYNYILWIMLLFVLSCEEKTSEEGPLVFNKKHWLIGKWKTAAFSGSLFETWRMEGNQLYKEGHYVEKGDTTYSEMVIISVEDSTAILRALPINRAVLEYRGIEITDQKMVFESKVEKEPFQIIYESVDKKHFRRITKNNDDGIEYENVFEFERQ